MTRRCLAILLQCLHVIALTSAASDGSKWTYTGLEGKYDWPKKHPYCGGVSQSPIDIRNELLQYDPALRPVEVRGYSNCTESLTLINNGHSVKMSLPSTMYISSLPHRYSAAQLHLHWGSTDHLGGSEHTINGKQYPAEMHVVHFNSDKYSNLSTAVDKADGLAVLGVFIDVGAFNPVFDHILSHLGSVRYRDQVVQIPAFNIFNLLPERLDEFYRYDGSLTTPPCYPSVLWTVFRNPVRISQEQLLSLQTVLYSTYVNEPISLKMNQNYRHPQETNERHVVVSFRDGRGNVRRTTPSFQRKQIIQKLQTGDLADLADEGMSMLLPHLKRVGNSTSPASAEWAAYQSGGVQNTHYRAGNPLHPKINYRNPKNWSWPGGAKVHTQDNGSVLPAYWKYWQTDISNPRDDKWSFRTLEQHIRRGLKRSQTEREVANAISEVIFPELNLRSYLEGRSVLTVPTIRNIIRSRRTEEAAELDRALTKAVQGPIKIPAPFLTHPANLKQKAKFLMNQTKLGQSVTQANAIGPVLSYRHEMED